jgi:predicted branched-subunit amino acid permease
MQRLRAATIRFKDGPTGVVWAALTVGAATGASGLAFGALSTTAGLSLTQTAALSMLMFTGASQFAFVSAVGAGGNPFAGAATAALLGARNAFYGLRLSRLLNVRSGRRMVAAHLMIDESAAMALGQTAETDARLAFWATGWSVFAMWNIASIVGALGVRALPDPKVAGLDAAAPAAFLALVAPRITDRRLWGIALLCAAVALGMVPITPTGVPVLLAAAVAVVIAVARLDRSTGSIPQ